MCLLVMPFSVIVSRIDSMDTGNMKACLSTIGNLTELSDEKTAIKNIIRKSLCH